MEQQFSHESASILHELDLGRHTLFVMSDGSIDLLANDEQTPYLADNGISLDSDETYRLFISLQEQFKKEIMQYKRALRESGVTDVFDNDDPAHFATLHSAHPT